MNQDLSKYKSEALIVEATCLVKVTITLMNVCVCVCTRYTLLKN